MIPPVAHFIWLGSSFSWLHALAVVSAARSGGFSQIVLHYDHDLSSTPYWSSMQALPGFEARRVELSVLARQADLAPQRLASFYDHMASAAARSDVLRTLVLATEGGVYLDTDTVTIKDFASLRQRCGFFCGQEQICFPEWATTRHSTGDMLRAYGLAAARLGLRFLPSGVRYFHRLASFYDVAVNNAILGCSPQHPFVCQLLEDMLALSLPAARRRYAVGPHLLAATVRRYNGPGLCVLPPSVFYPLGPVISQHWWRNHSAPPRLDEVVATETTVVHWYGSNRSQKQTALVTPAYVRSHAHHQLFSALALPYLDGFIST